MYIAKNLLKKKVAEENIKKGNTIRLYPNDIRGSIL